jgi:hypothetical protein
MEIKLNGEQAMNLLMGKKVVIGDVELAVEAVVNPLEQYGIKWLARDGSEHVWPCEEHKGATVYPVPEAQHPMNGRCCK